MKVELNVQWKGAIPLKGREIREIVKRVLEILNKKGNVSILLCDSETIKELNKKWFGREGPTDVIAFPYYENGFLGDIAICIPMVYENAERFGTHPAWEMLLYIVHGILHLLGFEEGNSEMLKLQNQMVERLEKEVVKK